MTNRKIVKRNGGSRRPKGGDKSVSTGVYELSFSNFNNINDTVFLNTIEAIVPERQFAKLSGIDSTLSRTNNGATASNWFYQSSGINFDNGGDDIVGFDTLMSLYDGARCHRMKLDLDVVNLEAKPITIGILPSWEPYASNTLTQSQIQDLLCNPWAKSRMILTAPYGRGKLSVSATTRQIFGNDAYMFDDSFIQSPTADPATMWYMHVMMYPSTGTLTTGLGVTLRAKLTLYFEFVERQTIFSLDKKFSNFNKSLKEKQHREENSEDKGNVCPTLCLCRKI